MPFAKCFVGGKLNVSENCLDRHLHGATRNKAAFIWEGEPGEKTITYQQLHMVVTADGGYRRGAIVPLKRNVDEALRGDEQVERIIVFRRANNEIHIQEGRDVES